MTPPPAPVNLIAVFDFYLAAVAVVGLARRYPVYLDVVALAVRFRGRWPRVVDRLKAHHGLLVTREVLAPAAVAVALMALQMVLSRAVFPMAVLPARAVAASPWRAAVLAAAAAPMLAVDAYFLWRVGRFDRGSAEQYLDLAERWLAGWRRPAVRAVTLGWVDPRSLVDAEVRKGLTAVGAMVGWSMRWVAVQVGCRIAFGLAVWTVWAVSG